MGSHLLLGLNTTAYFIFSDFYRKFIIGKMKKMSFNLAQNVVFNCLW